MKGGGGRGALRFKKGESRSNTALREKSHYQIIALDFLTSTGERVGEESGKVTSAVQGEEGGRP